MSEGCCVSQFGGPYELLCDTEGGLLADLVEETGATSRDLLWEVARREYFNKINGRENRLS